MGALNALLLGVCLAAQAQEPSLGVVPPVAAEPVPELGVGASLAVSVLGGERFEGAFVAFERQRLQLATRDGQMDFALPLIVSVEVDGASYSPQAFMEGVRRWSEALTLDALSTPPPFLVGTASLLWAGAGPAVLGDWRSFLAYSIVEVSILGAGGVMLAKGQYGPLLPLAALDLLVHGWAGGESVREAKRRRRRASAVVSIVPLVGDGGSGFAVGLVLSPAAPGNPAAGAQLGSSGACFGPTLTAPGTFPY